MSKKPTYEELEQRVKALENEIVQKSQANGGSKDSNAREDLEKEVHERTAELLEANKSLKTEILERTRVEKALQESEVRFRLLTNISPAGIYQTDVNGACIYVNQSWCDLVELAPGEALGKGWQKVLHPDDYDRITSAWNRRTGSENIWGTEYRFKTRSGKNIWVYGLSAPVTDEEGSIIGYMGTNIDITERKAAEKALLNSEEKYRDLVENANSVVLRWDTEGNIIYMNPFGLSYFGYDEGELIGRNVVGTIVPETESNTSRDLTELMKDIQRDPDKHKNNENENLCKTGSRVWVSWTNKAVEDRKGGIKEILSIGNDITEKKLLENRVKEHTKELTRVNDELKKQTQNLEETNSALRVLLRHRDQDKKEFEEKVVFNVKDLVFPYVEKLRTNLVNDRQMVYLDIIKSNLDGIVSPFLQELSSKYSNLTPVEIKVANFVKDGKTTKEIAELLNSSAGTVNFHRNNLRKKLGLRNKKTNLRAHLLSLA